MSALKKAAPSLRSLQRLITTLMGESKHKVDRSRLQPMIWPYTRTAAQVQFPYKHHYDNAFAYKFVVWITIATTPLWYWVTRKVSSPEAWLAVEKWHQEDLAKAHKKEWEI